MYDGLDCQKAITPYLQVCVGQGVEAVRVDPIYVYKSSTKKSSGSDPDLLLLRLILAAMFFVTSAVFSWTVVMFA
ncbi:MAG: hypothetical protein ACI8WB_006034 [Phenylobacterium sp.]|jgi:hypothetical protein